MKRAIIVFTILLFTLTALAQSGSADTIYVEEPEKLNERRADVGLSPIEDYLEVVKRGVIIYFDRNLTVENLKKQ